MLIEKLVLLAGIMCVNETTDSPKHEEESSIEPNWDCEQCEAVTFFKAIILYYEDEMGRNDLYLPFLFKWALERHTGVEEFLPVPDRRPPTKELCANCFDFIRNYPVKFNPADLE